MFRFVRIIRIKRIIKIFRIVRIVRVIGRNNGPLNANGSVAITLGGEPLTAWNNEATNKSVNAGETVNFDFSFKPENTGTQTFSATVSVS